MAASDPSPYVATPTGALQGVAAFSWDGSAWQPSGRAGPDVATPTGVLQGVAPFSWDGAAWQPSGRAQPGVAAPGGVLDGVAVYTWSGSAWTPASGTATPSTPSGALRGIAAFSWDGAAWQPSAQARASVPTPYGVLAGVAMFNWGGSLWQAGGAVPAGATLDLSFLSGALDPRITFTRGSNATYFDVTGTMQTATSGTPRFDNDPVTHALRGLLIEEARTNLLSPSVPTVGAPWFISGPATLGGSVTAPDGTTSTTSLVAASDTTNAVRQVYRSPGFAASASTAYVVSAFMKRGPTANGCIQINTEGAVVAGVAYFDLTNGTAVVGADLIAGLTAKTASIVALTNGWYRVSFGFTTQTGATGIDPYFGPCVTVSSSGDNRSSVGVVGQGVYVWGVQVEQGAFATSYIATTAAAVTRSADVCYIPTAAWYNAGAFSMQSEFSQAVVGGVYLGVSDGTFANSYYQTIVGPLLPNVVNRFCSGYTPTVTHSAVNGAVQGTGSGAGVNLTGVIRATIGCSPWGFDSQIDGWIRRVRFWPRILTDAEMQSVTT